MEANYNANMYLTPDDLNQIENKIEELTNEIQEKIYDGKKSPLRNIKVGDDLSGKTLYLSFPKDAYSYIPSTSTATREPIIKVNDNYYIYMMNFAAAISEYIGIVYGSYTMILYEYFIEYNDEPAKVMSNVIRVKLPSNFGKVTEINTDYELYKYIQIYDNESILPDYVKKEWKINEIAYMQDIDRIEKGVENIGTYYNKPLGWLNTKNWFETVEHLKTYDYCTGIKTFSYQDINRWINNLNLIMVEEPENLTLWNSDKSEYYWDGHTEEVKYTVQYDGNDIYYDDEKIYYKGLN